MNYLFSWILLKKFQVFIAVRYLGPFSNRLTLFYKIILFLILDWLILLYSVRDWLTLPYMVRDQFDLCFLRSRLNLKLTNYPLQDRGSTWPCSPKSKLNFKSTNSLLLDMRWTQPLLSKIWAWFKIDSVLSLMNKRST